MSEQSNRIDDDLILSLKRGVRSTYVRIQAERPEGAPGDAALLVLARVQRQGSTTMGDLSRHFGISPASVNQSVASLERAGHVRRSKDPADGRRVLVQATDTGVELAVRGRAARDAWLRGRLEGLPDADLAVLRRAATLLQDIAAD